MNTIVCNNCGKKGHIYKNCKYPIMSLGHLLFRIDDEVPKILMVQRKDSLCYIEFIRGKYNLYNIDYIQILINKCTQEEKQNILTKPYETLWRELWLISDDSTEPLESTEYLKGFNKFNKLSNGFLFQKTNKFITIQYFVKNSNKAYSSTEWEIPKGRRNKCESNLDCAKREFSEETNYIESDYKLIKNIQPFTEEFVGENGVRYKYIYYIGYLINFDKLTAIDPQNINQYTEIKDIQWLTKGGALNIIRDYHHTRKIVINQIFDLIQCIQDKDEYKLV